MRILMCCVMRQHRSGIWSIRGYHRLMLRAWYCVIIVAVVVVIVVIVGCVLLLLLLLLSLAIQLLIILLCFTIKRSKRIRITLCCSVAWLFLLVCALNNVT